MGDDCPVFDGLFDYCAISAGGSMGMWRLMLLLFEGYTECVGFISLSP